MINRNDFNYLIHLIKCALNNDKPDEKPSDVSFENVLELAIKHDVANLAFYAIENLENKPEKELYNKWKQIRNFAILRDANQQFSYDELIYELKKANIRTLEIQGTVVKKYYPDRAMRTMSDIDFVVDKENLNEINNILCKLGYKCDCHIEEIDAYRYPNINLEFHSKVFDKEPFTDCYLNAFEYAKSSNGLAYYFGDSDFYVYNMFHLLKHLYYASGCGIRRFCDIYVLNKALKDSLDREYIHKMYEKCGISDKAETVERLSDTLFGEGDLTDDLQVICDELMDSAVHGTSIIFAKNELNNTMQKGKRFAKLRFILKRVFPSYEYMVWLYPQLEGKKALIPLYRLRRIFKIAFKERYKIKRVGSTLNKANNEIEKKK